MSASVGEFLAAIEVQDAARARRILDTEPHIAAESLHVAAAIGAVDEARRLIAEDGSRVRARVGATQGEPLLFLCYSTFHGESPARDAALVATAKLLLDAGADPNTRDARFGVPVLHGVTGWRSVPPIARLLLDFGANPTDGESVFHAAEHFHEDALELLVAAGADLNVVGDWGNTAVYFLVRWWDLDASPRTSDGVRWLLAHGADPDVRCGRERETALHAAVRRGQSARVLEMLLEHGADVHARRDDGRTAWMLARIGGYDALAAVLEEAGAAPEALSPTDELIRACERGDVEAARQLASPERIGALNDLDRTRLPDAAAMKRDGAVFAFLAAGFPLAAVDHMGATALHHAAMYGRRELVRALVDAGAPLTIRDREHDATPLEWATFGAEHVKDPDGDYVDCVNVLRSAERDTTA